jgi:hypothetical protein
MYPSELALHMGNRWIEPVSALPERGLIFADQSLPGVAVRARIRWRRGRGSHGDTQTWYLLEAGTGGR